MRDGLPRTSPKTNEMGVINLDSESGPGTHWVAYGKKGGVCTYFDSFGDLKPPSEFLDYMSGFARIKYNYDNLQPFNSIICGHLCLYFLCNYNKNNFNKRK